ncbi:MAG: hypothetical protein EPN82_06915 [Bacteroidetes bacterium]|nr:MAG: hypothetical protein EPN82_06915 [Bacteroidota bacterium]
MKKLILFLFVASIVLVSCRKEEKVIDYYKETFDFLAATDSDTPSILLVELPGGTVTSNDVFLAANGEQLSGKVTKMVKFRDKIYLLMPSKHKIEVINKINYKRIATIDFSATGREPTDICFANATAAYVAHGNDTTVSLVDISDSVFKVARIIKVGVHPVAIASSGNQIFVANQKSNTVSVIDSRYHTVTQVPVHTAPSFVDINSEGSKAIVISLGAGKIDSSQKTAAKATIINVEDHTVFRTTEIGYGSYNAKDQIPAGIVISDIDMAYMLCQDNIFSMDANFGNNIFLSVLGKFTSPYFDLMRTQLVLLKNNNPGYELYVINPEDETVKNAYAFSTNISCILPL